MKLFKSLILTLLLFSIVSIFSKETLAQSNQDALRQYNQERIDYNKSGMLILGSWAVGNIATGAVMAGRTSGETRAFHQMNMYWNSVNLLIAGFGYFSAMKEESKSDLWETFSAQNSIEKILLLNAGLDLAYVASGFWLNERGRRLDDGQFQGFGKSIMLQGAFLMSFDLIKYFVHRKHSGNLAKIVDQVSLSGNGVSFRWEF
ncbi:hypothetical protein A33Q_0026 [Indibacter alkaliphilus LW1]|uniref:Uncharacterized protein n=1 Tax=Indibacter alkaliphilus (strain CCUG 57479 / KCTC 22604 / LW1) TaxID=1189612 RepID=S2DNR6_INDAL|nr:hypothetical protein [Indibacter alkaliphilus]EPA00553.1 hypothetical protein A33Q_0026 [Indibacter alkaliphilus LW1]